MKIEERKRSRNRSYHKKSHNLKEVKILKGNNLLPRKLLQEVSPN